VATLLLTDSNLKPIDTKVISNFHNSLGRHSQENPFKQIVLKKSEENNAQLFFAYRQNFVFIITKPDNDDPSSFLNQAIAKSKEWVKSHVEEHYPRPEGSNWT